MRLLAFLALAFVPQESRPPEGAAIERTVRAITLDTLNRRQEVRRKESIRVQGDKLSITDLTFGSRLIIRPDLKRVWKADLLAGEYSEVTFEEIAAVRRRALEEIRAARARVPGTPEERELDAILEGYDQFAAEPKVELKADGARREILMNGDRVRVSLEVDPARKGASGAFEALAAIGGFPPAVAARLKEIEGLPVKGTVRYLLFLHRVVEEFEVTSARTEPVPESEFELPKGLRKVPLQGFGPPPERKPSKPGPLRPDFKEDEKDANKPEKEGTP